MSFDRLTSLERQPTTLPSTGYSDDPEFTSLTTSLSSQLFSLTSNVSQLNSQLALVGSKKDSEALRHRVRQLIEDTRAYFKTVGEGVKRVQCWPETSPSQRYIQDKLSHQFSSALSDFQATQRLSAEKTRQYVMAARHVAFDHNNPGYLHSECIEAGNHEVPVPLVQQQVSISAQGDVDFQESLIIEREEEIRGIEQGITELNDIFKDLGTMVNEQGVLIDSIDANVNCVATDHHAANMELRQAARSQKGARNRACCVLFILAIVLMIVFLAVCCFLIGS